jgi:3-deoxy-D-manno-octulosonate 8-phosphate phosphatase (KDO 8-P phosphatase)
MPSKNSAQARAKKIKLILFDVDGVLTDGKIWIFPAPAGAHQSTREHVASFEDKGGYGLLSQTMIEAKGFHAHDGAAFSLARLGGIQTGLITKRISETVALRARDLKKVNLQSSEAAFVGDDVIDLPVMRNCGFAIAVANARKEVKREAHIITEHAGGDGAARDAIEYILKAQGKWKHVVSEYIYERSPKKRY